MLRDLTERLVSYKRNPDGHQQKLLDIANSFVETFPDGIKTSADLELGIELFKELVNLSYICSTREFENDHKLYRDILQKKIKVFKRCIPSEYSKLRGLTELLVGMKENELG